LGTIATLEQSPLREKLPALFEVCQQISAQRDLAGLFTLIAREATRLMNADRASVFLLDRETSELWSIVTLGGKTIRFDARLGIAGAAALTGKTINVEDAHRDPRFYPKIDARTGYRTRTMLAVPLRNQKGEIIGSVQVVNKKQGPFTEQDEEVLQVLVTHAATALETAQLMKELQRHRDQLLQESTQLWKEVEGRFATQNIIGTSEKIQHIVRLIEQISDSSVTVLISGESGTGKEMVAKAIHYNSPRARRPFVSVNCAALPESLIESELFGIEKGVATGVEPRIGKFEAAQGGTLFLDEIGDLSLVAQAKILRVLQECVVEHVGGRRSIPVDARILAATNKDMEAEIKKGTFRADLFYRLNIVHVRLPPLREVREDIPLLANFFLGQFCREMDKDRMKLASNALDGLLRYDWPGNIRQLENEIKRLVVSSRQRVIPSDELSEAIRDSAREGHDKPARSLKEAVVDLEKRMIREALEACGWNQQRASRLLGLSRQGLIKKVKRYGIS
jgi:Nif-specific regulatory protein